MNVFDAKFDRHSQIHSQYTDRHSQKHSQYTDRHSQIHSYCYIFSTDDCFICFIRLMKTFVCNNVSIPVIHVFKSNDVIQAKEYECKNWFFKEEKQLKYYLQNGLMVD